MSATGKWFVMMYNQKGTHVMPLVDEDGEVRLWDTEEEADAAGLENPFAEAFGFHAYEVGA